MLCSIARLCTNTAASVSAARVLLEYASVALAKRPRGLARTVTPGAGADAGGARTGGPGRGPVGGPGMFLEIGVAVGGISHSVLASGL